MSHYRRLSWCTLCLSYLGIYLDMLPGFLFSDVAYFHNCVPPLILGFFLIGCTLHKVWSIDLPFALKGDRGCLLVAPGSVR